MGLLQNTDNTTESVVLLKELIEGLEGMAKYAKFHNSKFTVEMVAAAHGVSTKTVHSYIKSGLIPLHPESTESKYIIRGDVGLSLDFDKLKRTALYYLHSDL